ncbi:MAG: hypothetical protein EX254_07075 [Flavobacteriaceae bacterium]|nr:tail fiber domain-containing protein [Bacteroidia bacterium]NNL62089.1 hypothetical protein [Flavobacteriaceae bacterium]RZV63138.1 MAG: hypothetical protein EX254_07075 [Flavobacteriaceae bacterium]
MRRIITLLSAMLFMATTFAQNEFINYKAVVKDANGDLVTNQLVGVQFTIYEDVGPSFIENHTTVSTDLNGLLIVDIGSGTATLGTFNAIDWSKYTNLQVEIDIDGGLDNLVDMGLTEFKSVPYALTAGNTAFGTMANVTSNALGDIDNDDFVFGSTQLAHNKPPIEDDSRMFFDKSKGAFRAGATLDTNNPLPENGTAWDDANVGEYSFAAGVNAAATGYGSVSIGVNNLASGGWSTALGVGTQATNQDAFSTGRSTIASGKTSTAMGSYTKAESTYSTALGRYNIGGGSPGFPIVLTDPLFEIGNGTNDANRNNALTVLKNGTITAPSFDLTEIIDPKALVTKEYADAQSGNFTSLSNGNTGVNTITPENELHVMGGSDASLANDSGYFQIGPETGANMVFDTNEIIARNAGAATNLYLQAEGGNTRIGGPGGAPTNTLSVLGDAVVNEDTPSSSVHALSGIKTHTGSFDAYGVYGENNIADFYGYGVYGKGGYTGVNGIVTPSGGSSYFGVVGEVFGSNTSGTNYGVFGSASGNVGSTNYGVYASGDLAYTGDIIDASDRMLKTNISTISNAMTSISLLNPSKYFIKESYQKSMNMSDKAEFGFIAQELQEVFPDLVSNNVHPGETKEAAPIEYLGVNYMGLIPILTKGIQEQQQEIQTLKTKVESQDQTIATLIARIEALENR